MNFYLCRLPGSEVLLHGASDELISAESLPAAGQSGFMFAPFGTDANVWLIQCRQDKFGWKEAEVWRKANEAFYNETHPMADHSTPEVEHSRLVREAKTRIEELEPECGQPCKIIVSRVERISGTDTVERMFGRLCADNPDAFCFLFSSSASGTWIGATPELLLNADGCGHYKSVALAGTRLAGTTGEWSGKDVEEHIIVRDEIVNVYRKFGIEAHCPDSPTTKRAGTVEHLYTPIEGDGTASKSNKGQTLVKALQLASSLSPTPALGGYPQKEAVEFIERQEHPEREYYGGFCGLYDEQSETVQLYATLRCGRLHDDTLLLRAGGGITSKSDAKAEWEETCRKMQTMKKIIVKR